MTSRFRFLLVLIFLSSAWPALAHAQSQAGAEGQPQKQSPASQAQSPNTPTREAVLIGAYGFYRANNDLLYYHLDIRVDPESKRISGKNTIRFRMLKDDNRIQIDLHPRLNIDRIVFGSNELKYQREERAVFIDFPESLKKDRTYSIDFYYSGSRATSGRFGGFTWATYLEGLYVEYMWGKDDAIKYLNGYKGKVKNDRPIVGERGVNADPP